MRSLSPRHVAPLAAALVSLAIPLPAHPAEGAAPPGKAPIVLAAPKDFDSAVRALETATGASGQKLHELPLGEARSFAVEPSIAEQVLDGNHDSFRKAGIYLFRHERSFGMAGEKDQLGVMKTADWRAVVRRVGTAGPKKVPSSEAITAWLEALAKDEPFDLREIGSDYLAGRFERIPKDPAAVAKRCAEFAPDLVAGRASTLALLTEEIRVNRTLYLIW
jgi:hypothetical protein